jgi:hypothetical protein
LEAEEEEAVEAGAIGAPFNDIVLYIFLRKNCQKTLGLVL